jgi:hypothetical protein
MVEWYILLAPLVMLPVLLLFAFVGCGVDTSGGAPLLTVTLRWEKSLGPDAVKVTFRVETTTSNGLNFQKQNTSTTFLEPSPEETFPKDLTFSGFSYGSTDPILCEVFCSVLDKDDKLITNKIDPITHEPETDPLFAKHEGTTDSDGTHWLFVLTPVFDLSNKIVAYILSDATA